MITTMTINVFLINGEMMSWKDATQFELTDKAMLFIHGPITKKELKNGRSLAKVETKYTRWWIPVAQIKHMDVYTGKTITDAEEIRKYEAFLKHGLDMTITPISHTNPPDLKEVEKKIKKAEGKKL